MPTTVASVEFDTTLDSTGLRRGLKAVEKEMEAAGGRGGHLFSQSFSGATTKELGPLRRALRGAWQGIRRMGDEARRTSGPMKSLGDIWRGLSHNGRQWTLIITAVASGMQQLATLSSAAGGGLFVLGGALTGGVVGLVAFGTALSGLFGELEDIPAAVRPAAKAFQDLKTPLTELRDFLTERAFSGAEGAFKSLGNTIRRLTPAFGPLGDVIAQLTDDFAEWAASSKGIELVTGLIEKSAPIFDKLVRSVGKLGETLLTAFNNPRFQRAINDMLDGLGGLLDQFDEFVRSDDFTTWIDNTSRILGDLGSLLGTTAGMLSDLVTPEAIERTSAFLGNLEKFMPHLGDLLDILGTLDPFGLIAEALVAIGDALEPLAGPMKDLADGLNDIISVAIDEWGSTLKGVSDALAPVVQALADMVKDVPPETVRAIANALLIFAGGLLAVKAVGFGSAIVGGITGFFTAIKKGGDGVKKFPLAKLKSIGGGIASVAAIAGASLIPDEFWDSLNMESNLPQNMLTGAAWGSMFGLWGALIGAGIGLVTTLFTDFEGTMNDIGNNLLVLFTGASGPFGLFSGAIADWFAGLIPEEWRNSGNPFERFMYTVKFIIEDTGTAITTMVEDWNLGWQFISDHLTAKTEEIWTTISSWWTDISTGWTSFWAGVGTTVETTWNTITSTIATWITTIRTNITNFVNTVRTNWNNFWGGLGSAVTNAWNYIVFFVGSKISQVRVAFATLFATAGAGWNNFWSSLPDAVSAAWGRITRLVDNIMSAVRRALGGVGSLSRASGSLGGGGGPSVSGAFASGGVLNGPRRILAGEAGPEAIVPLRRNLSMVDPSVRWLSAIAQGRTPAMAGGGVVGGGRTNIIEAGAIVVDGSRDPLSTGVELLNRIANNLN